MQTKTLPQKAQFKRAMYHLAASLPPLQYGYKGILFGDDVKDNMKVKKTMAGEKVEREALYNVNIHNFVNHNRALKKIVNNAKSEIEMQSDINNYIIRINREYDKQVKLHPVKKLSRFVRFIAFLRKVFIG
jgi:hypothetical protein